MIDTSKFGGMDYGYYWVKEYDDSEWSVVYYDGRHFVWYGICHGNADWELEPSKVFKFNPIKLISPE